jgi:flagellar basal-body rod modification protein FlgD
METTIDPVIALQDQQAATAAAGSSGTQELGREEFLKLLVAKLENQDPLNPAEDTEFVAQLATFSSLEQLIHANGTLDNIVLGQMDLVNAQALDLIGKEALVESDWEVNVKDGVPDELVYSIPQDARGVTLTITDANGVPVRTFELETTPNGRVTLDWDGTGEDGEPLADGTYKITVNATDLDGEPMSIALFRSLPIDGVTFVDGWISLISGDQVVPFDSIIEFRAGRS